MTKGYLWVITTEHDSQQGRNKRVGSQYESQLPPILSFQTGVDGFDGARSAQEVSDRALGGRDQQKEKKNDADP